MTFRPGFRFIAWLVAAALLWAGLVCHATAGLAAMRDAPAQVVAQAALQLHDEPGGASHASEASPVQAPAEHAFDPAALMSAQPERLAGLPNLGCPRHPTDVIASPPYLEGPQRPPCANAIQA